MKRIHLLLLLAILAACGSRNSHSKAFEYLQNKGYQVVSYEGKVDSYVLTKKKLVEMPYMIYWGLQNVNPKDYLNKKIDVEKFVVSNHPLSSDKVDVFVFVADNEPFGGTSNPHDHVVATGYYSLTGKTLEDVQSKSFQEWMSEWKEKFKE